VLYPEMANLPSGGAAKDPIWQEALITDEPASDIVESSGDEPQYLYAVTVNPTRGTARVVEAGKSYEEAYEGVREVGVILIAGIGVAFLLSIGGAYLLARTVLRPVEAVTATARKMGERDLGKRLPVANPNDEIGRLTTTINDLLARLDAAFEEEISALDALLRLVWGPPSGAAYRDRAAALLLQARALSGCAARAGETEIVDVLSLFLKTLPALEPV